MFPNVRAGDTIRAEHIHQLIDEIKKAQIKSFKGGNFFSNTGGTSLSIESQSGGGGGGGSSDVIHPFKVVTGYDSNGGKTLRVAGQSYLQNIETGIQIPITDLGAVIGGPNDNENDQGQFSFPQIGDMVWLTIEVYGLIVTSAYIEHGTPGEEGAWPNFPAPVEQSEDEIPECRYSRIALAEIHGEGEDVNGDSYRIGTGQNAEVRIVRQLVNTHLGVKLGVLNYVVSPIIMPWAAPGRVTWTP